MQLSINHSRESVNEATGEEQKAIESDLLVSWVPAKCEICMQKLREIKDKDHCRLKRFGRT